MRGIHRFTAIWIATAGLIATSSHTCLAASLAVPVLTQSPIRNANGEPGILLEFGDLSALTGKRILYAKLTIRVAWDTCGTPDNNLRVRVPRSEKQTARFDLLDSWEVSAGALVDSLVLDANPEQSRDGLLEVLVNEIVQGWADGKIANYGLLLTPQNAGCAYSLKTIDVVKDDAWGTLVVRYEDK